MLDLPKPIILTRDNTIVHWDVEDFPLPPDYCVRSMKKNLTKVLMDLGYRGNIWNMFAYSSPAKISEEVEEHLRGGNIILYDHGKTKFERLGLLLLNLLGFARARQVGHPAEFNMIVIAKDVPDVETQFFNVLKSLVRMEFNVYLAVPDDCLDEEVPPLAIASRVWRWSILLDGGKPIERIDGDADSPLEKLMKNPSPVTVASAVSDSDDDDEEEEVDDGDDDDKEDDSDS